MLATIVKEGSKIYQGQVDYDGLWKKVISDLFEEFVLFVAPNLYEVIDFARETSFLQQELYKEVILEKKGRKVADQIVKVFLKDGGEKWILIHIEIQGEQTPNFSKRMFEYFYKIYDKFDKEIFAIAIITDSTHKKSNTFQYSFFGTKLTYEFNTYRLADQDEEELSNSSNPFAIAVLAGIYVNETKNNVEKRYKFKRKLMELIIDKFKAPEENRIHLFALLYFLDYILQIPEELTTKLREDLIPIISKEDKNLIRLEKPNLPPTLAKIMEEEKDKVKKDIAIEMLQKGMDINLISEITKLSIEDIETLGNESTEK